MAASLRVRGPPAASVFAGGIGLRAALRLGLQPAGGISCARHARPAHRASHAPSPCAPRRSWPAARVSRRGGRLFSPPSPRARAPEVGLAGIARQRIERVDRHGQRIGRHAPAAASRRRCPAPAGVGPRSRLPGASAPGCRFGTGGVPDFPALPAFRQRRRPEHPLAAPPTPRHRLLRRLAPSCWPQPARRLRSAGNRVSIRIVSERM